MANTSIARGLVPMTARPGAPNSSELFFGYKDASDTNRLGINDPVKYDSGQGSVNGAENYVGVTRAAAGDAICGVMVGRAHIEDRDVPYSPASEADDLIIEYAVGKRYIIEEDNAGGDLALTDIGKFCDLVINDCSTSTGLSAVELDSSSASASSGQVRIVDILKGHKLGFGRNIDGTDNAVGAACKWVVEVVETQGGNLS